MAHKAQKRGFFRSAIDALIEARQKQADRYVNPYLMHRGKQALPFDKEL